MDEEDLADRPADRGIGGDRADPCHRNRIAASSPELVENAQKRCSALTLPDEVGTNGDRSETALSVDLECAEGGDPLGIVGRLDNTRLPFSPVPHLGLPVTPMVPVHASISSRVVRAGQEPPSWVVGDPMRKSTTTSKLVSTRR